MELTQMEQQQIVHIQELNTRLAEAEVKIADLIAALKKILSAWVRTSVLNYLFTNLATSKLLTNSSLVLWLMTLRKNIPTWFTPCLTALRQSITTVWAFVCWRFNHG